VGSCFQYLFSSSTESCDSFRSRVAPRPCKAPHAER
jgi:hypothetical protein